MKIARSLLILIVGVCVAGPKGPVLHAESPLGPALHAQHETAADLLDGERAYGSTCATPAPASISDAGSSAGR